VAILAVDVVVLTELVPIDSKDAVATGSSVFWDGGSVCGGVNSVVPSRFLVPWDVAERIPP